MTDFVTARTRMVDNQLRTSNVTDHRILSVMGEVPREAFLPEGQRALAYADVVHALGDGRQVTGVHFAQRRLKVHLRGIQLDARPRRIRVGHRDR